MPKCNGCNEFTTATDELQRIETELSDLKTAINGDYDDAVVALLDALKGTRLCHDERWQLLTKHAEITLACGYTWRDHVVTREEDALAEEFADAEPQEVG